MKILAGFFLMSLLIATDNPTENWEIFAHVKFDAKFYKDMNEHMLVPFFDSKIKAYEGKEFILRGHFIPMDLEESNVIVLSKYPFSQCFFCGGAGPESVAEIKFAGKHPRFKADQIITVKGILSLNDTDINHMNFILKNASLVTD